MNNFININDNKNSIIVGNLQEKVKDYARHAFAKKYDKKTIKVIGKFFVLGVNL